MALGGTYLPPVVAEFTADASSFYRTIADVKAALADLAKTQTDIPIGADVAPFERDIAALRAQVAGMSATITVGADIAPALAKLAELRAAASGIGGGGVGGGLTEPQLSGLLAGATLGMASGGGGGGKSKGLLATLGMGGGVMGMAAAGSLASFMGLGFEHVLTIGAGLVGSAAGGLGGAALLGLGAGGTMAVGMGSDMAVMRETMGEVKSVTTAYDQLSQAIAIYGKNSQQAAQAQNQVTYALAQVTPVARAAVAATAQAAMALENQWALATGPAQVQSTLLMRQGLHLASVFVPLIATAANRNQRLQNIDLKPLFSWLESTGTAKNPGGMQIFKNLEAVFYKNLPNAIHAFNEAVRLLLRTINLVATSGGLGKITAALNRFFTAMNSAKGFARWTSDVHTLLAMTHTWFEFLKQVFITIIDFASLAAKLWTGAGGKGGKFSILGGLTTMLKELDTWMVGSATLGGTKHPNQGLAKIFQLHKTEILLLLAAVGQIAAAFGKLYVTVAPAALAVAILGLRALVVALAALSKIPFAPIVLGLGLIATKFGLITPVLLALGAILGPLKIHGIDVGAIATAVIGITLFSKTLRGLVWGPLIRVLQGLPLIGRLFSTGGSQAIFSGAVTRFGLAVTEFAAAAGVGGAGAGGAAAAAAGAAADAAGGAAGAGAAAVSASSVLGGLAGGVLAGGMMAGLMGLLYHTAAQRNPAWMAANRHLHWLQWDLQPKIAKAARDHNTAAVRRYMHEIAVAEARLAHTPASIASPSAIPPGLLRQIDSAHSLGSLSSVLMGGVHKGQLSSTRASQIEQAATRIDVQQINHIQVGHGVTAAELRQMEMALQRHGDALARQLQAARATGR